jgi:hypothetical protein
MGKYDVDWHIRAELLEKMEHSDADWENNQD